jgi:hypothetical protein
LPNTRYHLTARAWKPLGIPVSAYLDRIEGECRFWVNHQDPGGALLDPFNQKEWQYSTPYFAYAVGTLIQAERAKDLLSKGILAMDHACANFASGKTDGHSEFFVPPLTGALALYAPFVPAPKLQVWRTQMSASFRPGGTNNWRTYFMKGQWLRAQAGLISVATSEIESDWSASQRGRIAGTRWNLYHDTSSDPDSLAVEAVGRGNLLALGSLGYSGPSQGAISTAARKGTETTLLTQDPTGQAPTNGRTDDHVWVDVGYQLAFETMAEEAQARHEDWRAGQYQHAAELAFQNIERWRRSAPPWKGSFFVTKNKFDPTLRVGYQTASQYSNYNGSILYHTAEAYHTRRSITPLPPRSGDTRLPRIPPFPPPSPTPGAWRLKSICGGRPVSSTTTTGPRWESCVWGGRAGTRAWALPTASEIPRPERASALPRLGRSPAPGSGWPASPTATGGPSRPASPIPL